MIDDRGLRQRLTLLVRAWETSAKGASEEHAPRVAEAVSGALYGCAVDLREVLDAQTGADLEIRITEDTARCMDNTCSQSGECARYLARNDTDGYIPMVATLRTGQTGECGFFIDVKDVAE